MRILVADDDPTIRALLTLRLSAENHEVTVVVDGEQALLALAVERPDALVLDVMMPGLDGWAVLEHVRRDPATRSLPVVLLTARDRADDMRRGYEAGASSVLSKDRTDELAQTVLALTSTRRLAQPTTDHQ